MRAAPETCDVCVIGLGPAGSSAAIAAARAGVRVIAIDRRREAGLPVQCAEFVPMMLGVDSGPVSSALIQPIAAMETFVESAHDRHSADFRGRMIDRARFDRALVGQAEAAGVEVRLGCEVRALGADGVVRLADGSAILPRVLIGGDGPRSRVGAAIGCLNSVLVETRQVSVPLIRPQESTDIFLSTRLAGGYAWLFPKGDVANVGLGIDRRWRNRLKPELDNLLDLLAQRGTIGREVFGHTGGAIPVGGLVGLVGRLGEVRVLLAGDAAGLANPVTGAGIPAACHSGTMAGEAAALIVRGDPAAVADYHDEIEALFGASLRRAVDRREELLAHFEAATAAPDDLRRGWIAYPAYWTATALQNGDVRHELLEA